MVVKLQLFEDYSYRNFTNLLEIDGVEYSRRFQLCDVSMLPGMSLQVFSAIASATPWGALAIILISWVNSKKSRKVVIATKDKVINLEGYSAKEAEKLIEKSVTIDVIDVDSEKT